MFDAKEKPNTIRAKVITKEPEKPEPQTVKVVIQEPKESKHQEPRRWDDTTRLMHCKSEEETVNDEE